MRVIVGVFLCKLHFELMFEGAGSKLDCSLLDMWAKLPLTISEKVPFIKSWFMSIAFEK